MRRKNATGKSLLTYILMPIMVLILIEALIFLGVISIGGIRSQMRDNAREILQERVASSQTDMQNTMLFSWGNLSALEESITSAAEELEADGSIDLETLDDNSDNAQPLVDAIASPMIATLRTISTNSVFVIFDTGDTDTAAGKPGLYITDEDIMSSPSVNNQDLHLEIGSAEAMKSLHLSSDDNWRPVFSYTDDSFSYNVSKVLKAGQEQPKAPSEELGCWSWIEEENRLIYVIPLRTSDGTVIGVLGTAVTDKTLQQKLPAAEVHESENGYYLLATHESDSDEYTVQFSENENVVSGSKLEVIENSFLLSQDAGTFLTMIVAKKDISLYSSNTINSGTVWTIVAAVPENDLYAFSNGIYLILLAAIAIMLVIGLAGAWVISWSISRPIQRVHMELQDSEGKTEERISRTNITEVDHLLDSIETLNNQIVDDGKRLQTILNLSSVRVAAFEVDYEHNTLYISDNFFDIVHVSGERKENYPDIASFRGFLQRLSVYQVDQNKNRSVYCLPGQEEIYVEIHIKHLGDDRIIGLAEDVTERVLERKRIENERDHDVLTGLMNRGAFRREAARIFAEGESVVKNAAWIMMDLDNLKHVNDTFGHSAGDGYIRALADTIRTNAPERTLTSRISGDEFNVFIYGYESKDEIRQILSSLQDKLQNSYLTLEGRIKIRLSVSAGIAWYPDEAKELDELQQLADQAMYRVKENGKGGFAEYKEE